MTYKHFERDILRMNAMYKLADIPARWADMTKRLEQFDDILGKEMAELSDVAGILATATDDNRDEVLLATRVHFADLLADIIVYCASEAARWNIPLEEVLAIIMLSNLSKLGVDGQPIINPSNGKFEKGPYYWKPEPAIEHLMRYGGRGMRVTVNKNGVPSIELKTLDSVDVAAMAMIDMDAVTAAALTPKNETLTTDPQPPAAP